MKKLPCRAAALRRLLVPALCFKFTLWHSATLVAADFDAHWRALVEDSIERCSAGYSLHSADLQQSLRTLYQQADHQALWQSPQRREALQEQVAALRWDGLQPFSQGLIDLAQVPQGCEDIFHSIHYLQALEQLDRGAMPASEREAMWVSAGAVPAVDPQRLLAIAVTGVASHASGDDLQQAFDQARPQMVGYRQLREQWRNWSGHWQQFGQPQAVPEGPLLRPGMQDERLPAIAARLQAEGLLDPAQLATAGSVYDADLEAAVRAFQWRYQLQVDGIVGPQTVLAMNVPLEQRSRQVAINLERMRWLSSQLADYSLLVNIAGAHGRLYRDGVLLWDARVQAGRASRATPDMISVINRITLNPSWTVPPTILRQDVLPRIRADLAYLEEQNMDVLDAAGRRLDPASVDWQNPGGVILRQRPGPDNALGRQVFRLPNPFSIYLHDTPSRYLFDAPARHFSSGCVRMDDAASLMWLLVQSLPAERRERVQTQLDSGQTHEVSLPDGPQVVLAYWTVEAIDGGLRFMVDPYQRDVGLMLRYFGEQSMWRLSDSQ